MKPLPLNVVEKARDVHDAIAVCGRTTQQYADVCEQVQRIYNALGRYDAELARRRKRLRDALGLTPGCKARWRDKSTGRWVYWKFYSSEVFDVDGVIKIKLYGCRTNSRGRTNRPIPDKVLYEGEVFDVDGVIKLHGPRANSRGHTSRPIPDEVLYEGEVFADGKWRPILP